MVRLRFAIAPLEVPISRDRTTQPITLLSENVAYSCIIHSFHSQFTSSD